MGDISPTKTQNDRHQTLGALHLEETMWVRTEGNRNSSRALMLSRAAASGHANSKPVGSTTVHGGPRCWEASLCLRL